MNASRTLRCVMKMRTCGLFWHKVIVSLTLDAHQQGLLTIARPKVFGGKMRIPLNQPTSLVPVSAKEARRFQLSICCGPRHRRVTLRAPTSAVYETWWAALENALTQPNFAVVAAHAPLTTLAPVLPARHNTTVQPKHTATLETVLEVEHESDSLDEVPMLEAEGPSSLAELDILASWRTWGSLDYFATPPNNTSSLTSHDEREDSSSISTNDMSSDTTSVYSDISEFWSRQSELEAPDPATDVNYAVREPESQDSHNRVAPQPQDDEVWLDEIALFAFRHKVGAARRSEQRPQRSIMGDNRPLLKYVLLEQRS
ncbi:hypothetical protein PR003_g316 [Phytophthora rubi]|uniref:PH domain-containing protein n=1 Tax=Phytophthora rubi TaxID=129364 RepID=A0A6A3PIY3_9STRA|nr:hypothetical protein PR002_g881 [Phytophthora rubi]KAE9052650.1 hypothetical protein PR001_g322 [Phytophthora rubi]KAE9360243.1 hypothetical protein PR003_g316 [Phytophthora rubi]